MLISHELLRVFIVEGHHFEPTKIAAKIDVLEDFLHDFEVFEFTYCRAFIGMVFGIGSIGQADLASFTNKSGHTLALREYVGLLSGCLQRQVRRHLSIQLARIGWRPEVEGIIHTRLQKAGYDRINKHRFNERTIDVMRTTFSAFASFAAR
jgi:hypothetical protein